MYRNGCAKHALSLVVCCVSVLYGCSGRKYGKQNPSKMKI